MEICHWEWNYQNHPIYVNRIPKTLPSEYGIPVMHVKNTQLYFITTSWWDSRENLQPPSTACWLWKVERKGPVWSWIFLTRFTRELVASINRILSVQIRRKESVWLRIICWLKTDSKFSNPIPRVGPLQSRPDNESMGLKDHYGEIFNLLAQNLKIS